MIVVLLELIKGLLLFPERAFRWSGRVLLEGPVKPLVSAVLLWFSGLDSLRQDPEFDIPWILSLVVILAFCGLSVFVLNKKVRGVEVVK